MNLLINHCWCSDSIWGGCYDCQVIVSIYRISENKTYYDPPDKDWDIIEEDKESDILRLKPEVMEWLNTNIPDRKHKESPKGWAVGTDKYNSNSGISFNIFFHRQKDAMAFIKRWSNYKKPVNYLNYFKDIRKKLDQNTGKLKLEIR